jgi:hypothetical protein
MSQNPDFAAPKVDWVDVDTGEIKSRAWKGRDPVIWSAHSPHNPTGAPWFNGEYDEWEMTPLEMALAVVPDLEVVMDRARFAGRSVEIRVAVREPNVQASR